MFFYRPHFSDLLRMLWLKYQDWKKPEEDTTFVVTQHYINGDPPREVGRTKNRGAAEGLAHAARGDFDPFLKEVTIKEVPTT